MTAKVAILHTLEQQIIAQRHFLNDKWRAHNTATKRASWHGRTLIGRCRKLPRALGESAFEETQGTP